MNLTPITALETTTGLQSLRDRQDVKVLIQSTRRYQITQSKKGHTKRRIQRSSFLKESRRLEDLSPELEDVPKATHEWQNLD